MSFNKRYQILLTLYHRQSKALSCNKASSCSWERPCYVDSAIRNYKHLFGLSIHCKSIPNCSQLTRGSPYLNRECHTRMKPIFPPHHKRTRYTSNQIPFHYGLLLPTYVLHSIFTTDIGLGWVLSGVDGECGAQQCIATRNFSKIGQ